MPLDSLLAIAGALRARSHNFLRVVVGFERIFRSYYDMHLAYI
jgi:hypothetical protein